MAKILLNVALNINQPTEAVEREDTQYNVQMKNDNDL